MVTSISLTWTFGHLSSQAPNLSLSEKRSVGWRAGSGSRTIYIYRYLEAQENHRFSRSRSKVRTGAVVGAEAKSPQSSGQMLWNSWWKKMRILMPHSKKILKNMSKYCLSVPFGLIYVIIPTKWWYDFVIEVGSRTIFSLRLALGKSVGSVWSCRVDNMKYVTNNSNNQPGNIR